MEIYSAAYSPHTKNTLLKTAQGNARPKFLREYFFSHPRRNSNFFSPTLRCFNFFPHRTVRNWTDTVSIVGDFRQSVSKLDTTHLRTDRRATDNKGLAKVAVQWLIEHLCFVSSAVLVDSFVLRIRHLRQAPNR